MSQGNSADVSPDISLELLLVETPHDEEWHDSAVCAQTDPELFFPEKGGNDIEAKRVCVQCDVRAQCLAKALRNDERFGVWGGLSLRERDRLKGDLPVRPLTHAQNRRKERDEAIIEMASHQVDVPTIAAELGITGRTVHRVMAAHRAKVQESAHADRPRRSRESTA